MFEGVSAEDFRRHYLPACNHITRDNNIGKLVFAVTGQIQHREFARRAVVRMTEREQRTSGAALRMSTVLWDMFTGSAPYSEILMRTLHPAFWLRLCGDLFTSLLTKKVSQEAIPEWGQHEMEQVGGLGKPHQPGDAIIQQGEIGDAMLVILEGQVALMQESQGQSILLGVRSAGEVIGETELLDHEAHLASVVAVSPTRMLTIDNESFMKRINEDPSLSYRLFQLMSRRLRDLSGQVTTLSTELDRLTQGGGEGARKVQGQDNA